MATAVLSATVPPSGERSKLYEVVGETVVEQAPMGAFESWLAILIFKSLDSFVSAHQLGLTVFEMLFSLRPAVDRDRRPDLAFISVERWPRATPAMSRPGPSCPTWPSRSSARRTAKPR